MIMNIFVLTALALVEASSQSNLLIYQQQHQQQQIALNLARLRSKALTKTRKSECTCPGSCPDCAPGCNCPIKATNKISKGVWYRSTNQGCYSLWESHETNARQLGYYDGSRYHPINQVTLSWEKSVEQVPVPLPLHAANTDTQSASNSARFANRSALQEVLIHRGTPLIATPYTWNTGPEPFTNGNYTPQQTYTQPSYFNSYNFSQGGFTGASCSGPGCFGGR